MPLPFIPAILGAAAIASGAAGVKKAYDAKTDYDIAKSYNEEARQIISKANKMIEADRLKTQEVLESFGKKKVNILDGSIKSFYQCMEVVTDLDDIDDTKYDDIKYFNPSTPAYASLKSVSIEAGSMLAGGATALGSGALLAFGTYNVVMGGLGGLLVTATTGTALSTLTGVAATNATLAWLGGGALAAGGLGVAGGTAVLGGIVAGPALLIGGGIAAKKADEAYWKSRENKDKADTYMKEAETICKSLSVIQHGTGQMNDVLVRLDDLQDKCNTTMWLIINKSGSSFKNYDAAEKEAFYKAMRVAKTIKDVLETPILDENGVYNECIQDIQETISGKLIEMERDETFYL